MANEDIQKRIAYIDGQLDTLRMWQASATKANEYYSKPEANKTDKSYELMALLTGGTPITSRDNDVLPDTDAVKYRSGAIAQKTAAEKIRKSYELVRALTRG
jgi:hypothetical protein